MWPRSACWARPAHSAVPAAPSGLPAAGPTASTRSLGWRLQRRRSPGSPGALVQAFQTTRRPRVLRDKVLLSDLSAALVWVAAAVTALVVQVAPAVDGRLHPFHESHKSSGHRNAVQHLYRSVPLRLLGRLGRSDLPQAACRKKLALVTRHPEGQLLVLGEQRHRCGLARQVGPRPTYAAWSRQARALHRHQSVSRQWPVARPSRPATARHPSDRVHPGLGPLVAQALRVPPARRLKAPLHLSRLRCRVVPLLPAPHARHLCQSKPLGLRSARRYMPRWLYAPRRPWMMAEGIFTRLRRPPIEELSCCPRRQASGEFEAKPSTIIETWPIMVPVPICSILGLPRQVRVATGSFCTMCINDCGAAQSN